MKERFFELAKVLSKKSDHHQHRLGAVIVNKNRVISMGWNKLRTHPKSPHPYRSVHAELDAILGVPEEDLRGASIYVYREHKNGIRANSKPCPSCQCLLDRVAIKHIYYCVEDGYEHYSR